MKVAIFDVNETVFSLERLGRRLTHAGLPRGSLPLWFARVLRDGFALTAVGEQAHFRTLAGLHLRALLRDHDLDQDEADDILSALSTLDAHPDAAPAFRRLTDAGVRVVTLTNGDATLTERLLERNGLRDAVERCLSVDAAGAWKPDARAYRYALDRCGVAPQEAAMIAVHSWDVDGARRAGLRTGYATRLEGAFVGAFTEPDVTGADLLEVIDGLLACARDGGPPGRG